MNPQGSVGSSSWPYIWYFPAPSQFLNVGGIWETLKCAQLQAETPASVQQPRAEWAGQILKQYFCLMGLAALEDAESNGPGSNLPKQPGVLKASSQTPWGHQNIILGHQLRGKKVIKPLQTLLFFFFLLNAPFERGRAWLSR